MAILTFLVPGLSQLLRGDRSKATTMFVSAIITGALSGGLGWLACGIWSVVESKSKRAPTPAASVSFGGGGGVAVSDPGSGRGGLMGWTFKFTLLAMAAVLVFYNVRSGNALQSLELFGLKMQFSSSLAARAESGGGGSPAALAVNPTGELPSASKALIPTLLEEERNVAPALNSKSAANAPVLVGNWGDGNGATYVFQETASGFRMREMSRMWLMSVETASCDGGISQGRFVADCQTRVGTSGVIDLAQDQSGALVGQYRDLTTGAVVPMRLTR